MELGNIIDEHSENFQEMVKDREVWHAGVHGVTESDMTDQLNNNNKKI